jgi:hypothetical protein
MALPTTYASKVTKADFIAHSVAINEVAAPAVVVPETFGAVGNGTTDDQTAMQNWLNNLGPGKVGVLTAGKTYAHSNILKVTQADTLIRGSRRATILATDPNLSSFRVDANRVTIEDVRVRTNSTGRLNSLDHCGFTTNPGITDLVMRRCISEKSATTGFFMFGVTRFLLEDCISYDSLADSFHVTYGSKDGVIRRSQSLYGGDDGVAIVSYVGDNATTERIRVESPGRVGPEAVRSRDRLRGRQRHHLHRHPGARDVRRWRLHRQRDWHLRDHCRQQHPGSGWSPEQLEPGQRPGPRCCGDPDREHLAHPERHPHLRPGDRGHSA